MIKCRTCLKQVEECTSVNITQECTLGKTIKDILLLFIPGMVTSPSVGELICCKCTRHIQNFSSFIEKCLTVEKALIEENTKTQNNTKKQSTQLSNGNVDNTPVALIYINTHQLDRTSTENELQIQPIPINMLLSPDNNGTDNFDDTMDPMDQICDASISQSQFNTLSEKLVVEMETVSQLEEVDSGTSTLENKSRFCKTCGDAFMSEKLDAIQCLNCVADKKGADLDLSDSQSDHFDNHNELKTKVQQDANMALANVTLVKEVDLVKTSQVFKRLRSQFRDSVISIRQASHKIPQFLDEFSKCHINVVEYGPFNLNGNKRILLLGNPATQCAECRDLIKTPKLFKDHLARCHTRQELNSEDEDENDTDQTETYQCPFCETTTKDPLMLVEHLRKLHKVRYPFRCEKCSKTFRKRDSYLDHLKRFADNGDCSLKKCPFCEEILNKDETEHHLKSHRHIVCDKCGKNFSGVYKFRAHYATHDDSSGNSKGEHLCPHCGKFLLNQQSWKQHIETHGQRTRNYICHMCPKTFIRASSLRVHFASAHTDKSIACPLCDVKVKTKSALLNHHNLKHSETFAHICNICGKGFSRGDYFKRHMSKHSGPTPWNFSRGKKKYNYSVKLESKQVKCKYCLKEFKNVYLLRTHLLSHVKSIRYKCKFCDMTFANTATKLRHQKRHADPNFSLSCPICWKRMVNKEKLDIHLDLHEQSKKYICSICNQLFNSKYLLRHHVTKEHIPKEEIEKEKQTILSEALEEFLL